MSARHLSPMIREDRPAHTPAAPALKVVPAPDCPPAETGAAVRLRDHQRRTRALARAIARQDRIEAQLREAKAQVEAAFGPWAAGRRINRDEARVLLEHVGLIERRPL